MSYDSQIGDALTARQLTEWPLSKILQSSPGKIIHILFYLLFILVPLIFLPSTSELFEFNKIIVTYILTTLIVSVWAIRCIVEKKFIFRRTILDIPLLIFLASSILSLLGSIDMHTSWFGYYSRWNGGLLSLISYSLLYWAFVSNMDRKSALRTTHYALLTSIAVAIYAALEHFGYSISCLLTTGSFNVACWVQDVQNRVFATLGQPNWLAAYLVALIFIPLVQLTSRSPLFDKERGNKGVSYCTNSGFFILLFSTLLFTKSRSGLLAFGISSIVFWTLAFSNQKRITLKGVSLFILVVAVLILLIPNPVRDLIIKSPTLPPTGPALETGGTESGNIRKIVWTGALRIWQASPKNFFLGTGPETFAMAYYQYRPIEHNQTSEWELLYNKAHNEFLNYLATTGLLGFTSYLILLISMAWVFIKNSPNTAYRTLNIALLAGWLTISVTNFWGFSVVIMQLFLFLFPAIAITLEDGERSRTIADGERSRIHDK